MTTTKRTAAQSTKDALAKSKSELLYAVRRETSPVLVDSMEFIIGKIEALQSKLQ